MPASFNVSYGWDPNIFGAYDQARFYPNSSDLFIKVAGGSSDSNIIYAELVNRLQNSVVSVQQRTQYTPITGNESGSFIYHMASYRQIGAGRPIDYQTNQRVGIKFTVNRDDSIKFFGGRAFSASYGACCSSFVYLPTGTGNVYQPCSAGINITGDNTAVVTVIRKDPPFQQFEVVVACLTLVVP